MRANDVARKLDHHVRQVKVLYRDFAQTLFIENSEGVSVEGERVGTVFSVQVVSADGERIQTGYEPIGGTMGFELFDLHPPEKVAEVATGEIASYAWRKKSTHGKNDSGFIE